MKKFLNLLYIICFLAMVLVPLIFMNNEQNYTSDLDNKVLTDIEDIDSENLSDGVENYISDRIWGREKLISLYTDFCDTFFGVLEHPSFTYGTDGYVFSHIYNNRSYDDYLQNFVAMVVKIKDYCEDRGTPFYFMLNPEKETIYTEYLPEGYNYDDSWVEDMLNALEEADVTCIDSSDVLSEKSKTEQVFDQKYNSGHWNNLGAFYATNLLLSTISEDFPSVTTHELSDFNITPVTAQYLQNSEFVINEETPLFEPLEEFTNLTDDYSGEIKLDNSYRTAYVFQCDNDELPTALIFQGSYLNTCWQFLPTRFSDLMTIHAYQNIINFEYYYNIMQPDLVVFETAQYVFNSSFYDYGILINIDPNEYLNDEEIASLIATAESAYADGTDAGEASSQISYEIKEGKSIDEITIYNLPSDTKYAYVVIDDLVLDLFENEDGSYYADYMSSKVSSLDNIYVITTTETEQNAFKLCD